MNKKIPIILSGFMVAGLSGCDMKRDDGAGAKPKPAPLVQTALVQQRDLSKVVTYTGSIEPVKTARMASPAEGPVVRCSVREGDWVEAGTLLAKVGRSRIATTALEAAREELSRQKSEFSRVEQLVKSGSLAGEMLDTVRANLKRAEAQVAAMETGADDYEIHAPWAGVVSKVWIAEGNYVIPRAQLIEMFDPGTLIVRIAVPEQQALSVRKGTAVSVHLDAHPGKTIAAEITRVFPELDRRTRTVMVEAELKENVELLSGMFARVEIPVQVEKNAVVIPQSALTVRPGGGAIVWVLKDEAVHAVKVNPVLEANGWIAVESGIAADDVVVIRGNESLKEGASVRVQPTAGAETKEISSL
ncbi:efflux RND transporter periplasmic adaptor subunit [Pontiellaceae bacterium B12219]|nr:efflux RND transporter periplasmic adaptor subunit [Pontiellaceae bacterium B12219]